MNYEDTAVDVANQTRPWLGGTVERSFPGGHLPSLHGFTWLVLAIPSLKLLVLRGHCDVKALAEYFDIVIIVVIQLISAVKLHQPLWRYTFDGIPIH